MMQITEDTPPDMLAGAMDLTVHLPTGRTVKMSVERSTPMMDLLVQITTAHHLQHSGHILQALEMAPSSSGYTDKILPYKPNTPIGALDTQHVKVIPKNRSIPISKNISAGHQPFESTFRLQVHLPRNQLYVIRVSQYVYLGDIMKKVCEEKNLDSVKYEFRHPGNLDEVLDPKLTLSDYQITEVYIVSKGTVGLTQAFSSSDIMALRKEEERKQLQARTGGGVFSLIFKRGKTSMGSGSLSSENRSISPSHSDDSRSVTPPAIQQQILPPIAQETQQAPADPKPKPPQRKRRPAPKPPQHASTDNSSRKDSTDKPPSQISGISDTNTSDIQQKKIDNNGLTICHSRNSSDSSGYHEPSVLSDNCNTSLPRRPKSTIINEVVNEEVQSGENSRSSSGNLSKMSTFSKSTTSITSRKKKAAPLPPPVLKSEAPIPEKASPVVASPPVKSEVTDQNQTKSQTPVVKQSSAIPANETISGSISDNQILQKSVTTPQTPQTPQTKGSPRTSLNSTPSRQESRNSIIPDGITTPPPNESLPLENHCPKQTDIPYNESRSNVVLENKISSPIESVTSSKRSSYVSRNSLVLDNMNSSSEMPLPSKDSKINTNSTNIERDVEVQSLTSPKSDFPSEIPIPSNSKNPKQDIPQEFADLDSEWQYQLPSPPTAFRDSSPTNLTDVTNYDTITLQDFKEESVVTNPELFEKLKLVRESQCDTETISDFNSVMSDDDKPMLSKLTLENLEKRKSLVYNRELSTSLKIAQDNISSSSSIVNNNNSRSIDETSSKRSSVLSELEEVIQNGGSKSLMRHSSCVTEKTIKPAVDSNLPNFKISTYDKPKRKINIFEDDSVRSNDNSLKTTSHMDLSANKDNNFNCTTDRSFFTTKDSYIGRSMENISFKKQNGEIRSDDDGFKKPQEFAKYKSSARSNFFVKHQPEMQSSMTRSESFSMNYNMPVWKPQNPVQRSKSQVALNKYKDELDNKIENDECLSKSNSLFDVSGLQSLEVMRMIQTKLNTPSNSTEQLLEEESGDKQTSTNSRKSSVNLEQPANTTTITTPSVPIPKSEPESTTNNTKTYRYQGPPAINLSTWSERPKTKISLKEDTDYKINNNKDNPELKVKVSTSISNGSNNIEVKSYVNGVHHQKNQVDTSNNNVSIKINGTESITTNQESGNVVIKIGESQQSKTRFINHSSAVGYRKPLGNVNKIETNTTRPHSVAFDSDFDISRVPIVRSVELKKPFKESTQMNNTTITQINSINNESANKYADIYRSTESVNEINSLKPQTKNSSVYLSNESANRPVVRVNSFAQNRPVPTVMGFRGSEIVNDNTARSRKSWNVPNSYSTLPLKPNLEPPVKSNSFLPNSNVPFSHITLKRVDSNKMSSTNNDNTNVNNGSKIFGKVILRNTSAQIKNNVNNRYSTGSQFGVIHDYESDKKYFNGNDSGVMPPPPPLMPKVTSVTKKVVKNPESSSMDSRDELLSSIRSFGGMKGLRHVKV